MKLTRFSALATAAFGIGVVALTTTPAAAQTKNGKIELGAALSLTGKYSTAGQHTKRGYEMAVKYINEKGGVKVGGKSYKLEVKYYDDESTGARGAQLAERLIKQDGIKYMLGPYSSGLTVAIAPVTEKYKIPMIEGNGAARSLFTKGYHYIFAVLSTADQYLASAVDLAAENAEAHGKKPSSVRLALVFENDPFSQDVRLGVVEKAKHYGMKIVVDDKLPPELNDMSSSLEKIRALRPDMLVVSGHSKGAALTIRQMAEMHVKVPIVAMTHCESAQITNKKKFDDHANGTLCATQWDQHLNYKDPIFGTAMDYFNNFKKLFGYAPPYQAAESSAVVYVYAKALEKANSFNTEKVRDAIASMNIETFYGHVKFDKTGKNIAKPMVLRQIQNGKYVAVAPTKFATGKFESGS